MHAQADTLAHPVPAPRADARGRAATAPAAPRLVARWARHADEVQAAQRLRWRVFVQEMGARLSPPAGTPAGLDADLFDPHCEHLTVCTEGEGERPPRVVGTYRVLTPAAAKRVGALYIDGEFDLVRLRGLRPRLAELGRSCVDPEFRTGGAILLLWSSLAAFMQANGLTLMIGCASVSLRDGGQQAARLWRQLQGPHGAPPDLQVRPRLPLPVESLDDGLPAQPPPLLSGYLRCGARVLGPPAWDPDFGTADLPVMLDLADLPAAYRRRFLG